MTYPTQFIVGLALINVVTFYAFWWDKQMARGSARRIPETLLLLLAFLGGSMGAKIGQRVFHHKTLKEPFRSRLDAAAFLNSVGIVALALWLTRT